MGFGDVSPKEMRYLVPTLLYITCGLAVTTIALDLSSDFLRKLHHMGKKLADVRYTLIHFGSKTLCVGELVSAVGHTFKIPPADINRALGRLDELVVRTIDEKENPEKYRVYMELVDNPEVVFKLTEKLDFAEKDCEEIDA